jgi:hypothetical protein
MMNSHNYGSSNTKDLLLNSLVLYHLGHLHYSLLNGDCTFRIVTKTEQSLFSVNAHARSTLSLFASACGSGLLYSRNRGVEAELDLVRFLLLLVLLSPHFGFPESSGSW